MRWMMTAAAVALLMASGACGGRVADPIARESLLDSQLDCAQLSAERQFLVKRVEDLEDERRANRARTASRVPGAIIGSPISAIVFADLSVAIYREIAAARRRDERLRELQGDRGCDVTDPVAPKAGAVVVHEVTAADYGAAAAGGGEPDSVETAAQE